MNPDISYVEANAPVTKADVRRLITEVEQLKERLDTLELDAMVPSANRTQRVLVEEPLNFGIAFGVGLILAPVLITVVLGVPIVLIGGLLMWLIG